MAYPALHLVVHKGIVYNFPRQRVGVFHLSWVISLDGWQRLAEGLCNGLGSLYTIKSSAWQGQGRLSHDQGNDAGHHTVLKPNWLEVLLMGQ
jgi:hypothetical protein